MWTFRKYCAFFLLFLLYTNVSAQDQNFKLATVAFYNVENLFDTIDNPDVRDEEYTPEGAKNWDHKKYQSKITHLSEVISQIGDELSPIPPTIIGVSEVENRKVLEDLVNSKQLKSYHYNIVHHNSPDRRGIDVALLYQEKLFEVTNTRAVPLRIEGKDDFHTRDQLVVTGILDGEEMHFIVNHWPSRYGGEKRSKPLRNAAAKLTRNIVDSIIRVKESPKIIVMGDLNDDPIDESVEEYLNTTGKERKAKDGILFNPMMEMFKDGLGTLAYRDQWNLFDQLIVSEDLIGDNLDSYKLYKTKIFNRDFIIRDEGQYKGYPKRTHAGGIYLDGYSDHFPVYLFLIKKADY